MYSKVTLVRTKKHFGPISNGTNIHSWSNLTWNLDQKFTIQRFEGGPKEQFTDGITNFEVISNKSSKSLGQNFWSKSYTPVMICNQ